MDLIIGIEFERDAVSGVIASHGRQECRIHRTARVMIPPDENELPLSPLAVACRELMTILKGDESSKARVHVALPSAEFSFRVLEFPFTQSAKITEALPFEMEPHLPMTMDRVEFTWSRLASASDGKGCQVMAAAISAEKLDLYQEAMASAGIQPRLVTVSGYVAGWAYSHLIPRDGAKILIEADDASPSCMWLEHRCVRLFRPMYGNGADESGTPGRLGVLPRTFVSMYPAWLDRMSGAPIQPDQLYMAAGEEDADVAAGINAVAGLPLEAVSLKKAFSVAVDGDGSFPGETRTALVLLPQLKPVPLQLFHREGMIQKLISENPGKWIGTLILAILFLAVAGLDIWQSAGKVYQREAAVDAKIQVIFTDLFPDVSGVRDPFKQADYLEIQLGQLRDRLAEGGGSLRPQAIEVINEISRRIPDSVDVEISRMMISDDAVDLSGHTGTYAAVDEVQGQLSESPFFKEAVITSATNEPGGGVRFKMRIRFAIDDGSQI